jgi:hypothetical protein
MTLLAYPPGMLACLREGSRGGCNPPPADQPTLFEVTDDRPGRFIEPAVKGGSSRPDPGRRHP